MIPPLLSLPPPPRGRGPMRGGLGPRCGPYGRGWWGVNAEPPFPGPGHGVPPGKAFTKNRETLEGSKAGLLSRTPAHLRMAPRLWKTNLTALSADTFPKRATVDMKTSVPSTTRVSMDLLCETVPSRPGWKKPSVTSWACISLWPCGGYCEALLPTPIYHLSRLGSQVSHHPCVVSTLSSDPASRDWPSGPRHCSLQLPPGSSPSPSDC